MFFLQKTVLPAIEEKKTENLKRYGQPYILYSPDQMRFELGESSGYFDKILRIPATCFMTIEFCHPLKDSGQNKQYELATYTPSQYPQKYKCGAFLSQKEDDEMHRHDYFEMIYVLEGKRTMLVEGQKIILSQGDICIFDMNCAHLDVRSESEGTAIYYGMTRNMIDSFFVDHLNNRKLCDFFKEKEEKNEDTRYLIISTEQSKREDIAILFEKIAEELEYLQVAKDRMVQVLLLRLFCLMHETEKEDIRIHGKKIKGTKLFQAVAKYIYSNISTVNIQSLCDTFHYQADYYNRLIKKNTGTTYSAYVKQMRLERAKNLLINTDLTVKEIMKYLGYTSHESFYKIFAEDTGMTPISYRKKHRA